MALPMPPFSPSIHAFTNASPATAVRPIADKEQQVPRLPPRTEKILFLSWTVPPETTGSAVIVGNLAKQFSPEEMVIAGEQPCDRPRVFWKEGWPEIVYIGKGWPQTRRGGRIWRRCQVPILFLRCLYLVKKHRCTKLLVVFPSQEFLLVGYLTAAFTKTPLYPYFHNTYLEQYKPNTWGQWFAGKLQARVFARARHVFVMSQGMAELYQERYPGLRCSALVHSFNEDIPEVIPPPQPGSPLRFVLSGNINASCAEAVVRMCDAIARVDSTLTILSGTPRGDLARLGLLREGVRYATVSRDVVLRQLGEADIVILAHGFTGPLSAEEYRTIFPTKTIEYLLCGRPILAHSPADCYLTRFLREHQCALVVDEPSVEAILEAIHRLRSDAPLRSALVRNALSAVTRFRASHVASTLRSILNAR